MTSEAVERMRIDKWLWAARFFKTRSLASEAVDAGKVRINDLRAKPAKEVKPGDVLHISIGQAQWIVVVHGLADKRGPACVAQQLYEESAVSRAAREGQREQARLTVEPGAAIRGRPTKRDRRRLDRFGG
ncbi:MAG: RNA-binding S4 domain-containing protein [Sterolibacteriaceae bacterium]|nr:RNA-binding S4 domain-containing protein [Candidatus Methylophosphatis haderslevensis]